MLKHHGTSETKCIKNKCRLILDRLAMNGAFFQLATARSIKISPTLSPNPKHTQHQSASWSHSLSPCTTFLGHVAPFQLIKNIKVIERACDFFGLTAPQNEHYGLFISHVCTLLHHFPTNDKLEIQMQSEWHLCRDLNSSSAAD